MKKLVSVSLLLCCVFCVACGAQETANMVIEDFDAGRLIESACAHARAGDSVFFADYRPYDALVDDVGTALQDALDNYYDCAYNVDTVMWETVSYKRYTHFIFTLAYTKDLPARPPTLSYAALDLASLTQDTVWKHEDTLSFLIPAAEVTQAALSKRLDDEAPGFERDPYWGYLVEFCTWSLAPYTDYYVVEIAFRYRADAGAPEDVYVISDGYAAVSYMMEALRHGEETITVRARELPLERLQAIFGTAQVNDAADLVEEALECKSNYWGDAKNNYISELTVRYSGTSAQRETCRVQLKEALDGMVADIRAQGDLTNEGLYRAICQSIASVCKYDDAIAKATDDNALTPEMRFSRTAYGALVEGHSVCTGYAMAVKALCDRFSLPCWVMLGAFNGDGHAWNAVLLGGEIRYIDLTFFDTDGKAKHILSTVADFQDEKYTLDPNYTLPDWYVAALPDEADLPQSILPSAA